MNKEHIKKVDPNRTEHWDQIVKVKWAPYERQESVTETIEAARGSIPKHGSLEVLERINRRVTMQVKNKQPITPVRDLMNLVSDPEILRIAWAQIKNNKGTLTPGSTPETAEEFTNERLTRLSEDLRGGTFRWRPARRIYVEKPGKPEKRPLGMPDFADKVVQGALRLVLESVYEPIFEKHHHNYGFRPKKDPAAAIEKIRGLAQGTSFATEGDIKGAYNDVDHNTFMEYLSQVIQDKKVLRLIRAALQAGIMDDGVYEDTFLGIPQGGIVSPLFFNIYMHQFDLFVQNELPTIISPGPRTHKVAANYDRNRSTVRRADKTMERVNRLEDLRPEPFYRHASQSPYLRKVLPGDSILGEKARAISYLAAKNTKERATLSNWRTSFKKYVVNRLTESEKANLLTEYKENLLSTRKVANDLRAKTNYWEDKPQKIAYIRYADDWTIFSSGNKETAERIKLVVAEFLKYKLGLTLSLEKTRITDLRKSKVQFLGFEIYFNTHAHMVKTSKGTSQRFRSLIILPDTERLESRFRLKKYVDSRGMPREVGFLTVLEDHEIIRKYNQFMMGLTNYYVRSISYPSRLNRWMYIMYYSCLKTLATKHRLTVAKVIRRYGFRDKSNPNLNWHKPRASDLRISAKYRRNDETKWEVLLNYNEIMARAIPLRHAFRESEIAIPTIDFLTLNKVNFRTKFKSDTACAVCNAPVYQMHHIKPLKHKGGRYLGYKGFDKIVAALGRKQIPVCRGCHSNIHSGKYDGMSLHDLYDIRLVAPESMLQLGTPPQKSPSKGKPPKLRPSLPVLDEKERTYFSESLNLYYTQKL